MVAYPEEVAWINEWLCNDVLHAKNSLLTKNYYKCLMKLAKSKKYI